MALTDICGPARQQVPGSPLCQCYVRVSVVFGLALGGCLQGHIPSCSQHQGSVGAEESGIRGGRTQQKDRESVKEPRKWTPIQHPSLHRLQSRVSHARRGLCKTPEASPGWVEWGSLRQYLRNPWQPWQGHHHLPRDHHGLGEVGKASKRTLVHVALAKADWLRAHMNLCPDLTQHNPGQTPPHRPLESPL